jgi:hypothetical protein
MRGKKKTRTENVAVTLYRLLLLFYSTEKKIKIHFLLARATKLQTFMNGLSSASGLYFP